MPDGSAELFTFPFQIHCTRADVPERTLSFADGSVRVYWPFVHDGGFAPRTIRIEWRAVPVPAGMPRIGADTPFFETSGLLRNWQRPATYANSLRLDFYPPPEGDRSIREFNRLVGLFRWLTGQWWISRDNRFAETAAATGLGIDAVGCPAGEIHIVASQIGLLGFERLLTPEIFNGVCKRFAIGHTIPLSWDAFFDSVYFHAVQDTRRFVVESSTACELAILECLESRALARGVPPTKFGAAIKKGDLLFNLDIGLERLLGVSFKTAQPETHLALKHLWTARNNAAHGGPPMIVSQGNQRPIAAVDRVSLIRSVLDFMNWLQRLSSDRKMGDGSM